MEKNQTRLYLALKFTSFGSVFGIGHCVTFFIHFHFFTQTSVFSSKDGSMPFIQTITLVQTEVPQYILNELPRNTCDVWHSPER